MIFQEGDKNLVTFAGVSYWDSKRNIHLWKEDQKGECRTGGRLGWSELIRVMKGAHKILLELEELDENDLDRIKAEYKRLAEKARKDLKKGKGDTGVPEVRSQRKG